MYPFFAHMDDAGGSPSDGTAHLLQLLGALHPLAVHFPIALLLTAALLELISFWHGYNSGLRFAIAINLMLGTTAAIVAAIFGWIDAAHIGFEPDLKPILALHRWLGTSVALESLITVGLWFKSVQTGLSGSIWIYRAALWSLAVSVGITGHLGALLVYGLDYFSS